MTDMADDSQNKRNCGQNCPNCSPGQSPCSGGTSLFAQEKPLPLTAEQEKLKKQIYEKMNSRRRKFIDRIGYEQWDPFQAPNDPLDIRKDLSGRTIQDLYREFMAQANGGEKSAEWRNGAMECAVGIVKKSEKYQGIHDFCTWYNNLLRREGYIS